MTRDARCFILVALLFFLAPACFGQAEKKSMELKRILSAIANQHHVKFNFAENDVAGHSIFPPETRWPLRVKLTYISNRTLLRFKQAGIYITMYAPPKNDPLPKNRCAFVTDETGRILENAIVLYGQVRLLTGADGYFEFPPEISVLQVEQAGYKSVQYKVPDTFNDCAEIRMTPDVHELQEVVAERYIATGISLFKTGAYNIRPAKFGILPGLTDADVLKAMQQLPGINSTDETVSNINIRSGTHDQNLFTWNGIRLFQTGHFFGLISALNPNIAHNIEIYKNGTPAIYGESVSGNISITSHPETIAPTHGSAGINMIAADAHALIKLSENKSFEVSARRSYTDLLDMPTYKKYSDRIFQNTVITGLNDNNLLVYKTAREFYFYDFSAQYHHIIKEKHHFYADFIGIKNNLDFTQATFMPFGLSIKNSNLNQTSLGGNVLLKSKWSSRSSTELSAYTSYYNVDALNQSADEASTLQRNIINDTGLRFLYTTRLGSMYTLQGGYQYNSTGIENRDEISYPITTNVVNQRLNTHAVTAQLDYEPGDSPLYLQGGLRFNYIEQLKLAYAEPRLNLTYKAGESVKIQLQAETKSQTASQIIGLQDDFLGIENRRWVLADNNNLPVQHSTQLSAGLVLRNNGWLISWDNFYKKVKGITTENQSFLNQFQTEQTTGSYEVKGTEFLIQKQFRQFYLWLSYAYNRSNYRFNALYPSVFSNNFEVPHTVNNAITYEWKHLKISLGSKIMSGRPYTRPLVNTPLAGTGNNDASIVYNFPNGSRLGTYVQVNFSAGYTTPVYKSMSLHAGVSVLNILNNRNIINRYYRLNATQDEIQVVNIYSLARTPNAVLRIIF